MFSRTFSGLLADRRGRIFVIIPGLICIAAGLLILPFVHTLSSLLLSSAFLGIGFGTCQPATMALTVDLVSLNERGMAVSTYFLGFDSGIALGSFASGVIVTQFGFTTVWAVAAACTLAGLLGILRKPAADKNMYNDPL
jgi:MFS family permease